MENTKKELTFLGECIWVFEHLFFLLLLAMMIPPMESTAEPQYQFDWIVGLLVGGAMVISRVLALWRGREIWAGVVVKTAIAIVTAWVVSLRVYG